MLFSATPASRAVRPGLRARRLRCRPSSPTPRAAAPTRSSPTGSTALHNLDHRGAAGAEPNTGDGAGILAAAARRASCAPWSTSTLPDRRRTRYAVGTGVPAGRRRLVAQGRRRCVEPIAAEEGLDVLGWREVPVDPTAPTSASGRAVVPCPTSRQLFVARPASAAGSTGIDLDRRAFLLRKRAEQEPPSGLGSTSPSLSSRTLAYKGMLTTDQLPQFFPDLRDERCTSAIAIVHSRFSTNTFPCWPLAHPFRFVAHNGEINTVRGNRNRMRAREAMLAPTSIPGDLRAAVADLHAGSVSDSASLRRGARAAAPRRPPPAARRADDDPGGVGEPRRDGRRPARVLPVPRLADGAVGRPGLRRFTDGTVIGAVLDRNGLRPGRWWRTIDDRVVLASESGVLDVAARRDRRQGPAAAGPDVPGRHRARVASSTTRRSRPSSPPREPYGEWLHAGLLHLDDAARARARRATTTSPWCAAADSSATPRRSCGSCSRRWPRPAPSRSARWAPTPRPRCCPSGPRLLYDYFVELFAQVTNPPLDAIREELVTSHGARRSAPSSNLLEPARRRAARSCCRSRSSTTTSSPRSSTSTTTATCPASQPRSSRGLYDVDGRRARARATRSRSCAASVSEAIAAGARIARPLRPRLRPPSARRSRRCC